MKNETVVVELDSGQISAIDHYRLEHHCSRDEFLRKLIVPWELSLHDCPVPIPETRWVSFRNFFYDTLRWKDRLIKKDNTSIIARK